MTILTLFAQSPLLAVAFLIAMVSALTVHEWAHAWTAYKLGDDTPYLEGRVTFNPAAHLDPLGSILFILTGFGWGKPVRINPMMLPRRIDELWVALAGPVSNIVFAIALNLLATFTSGTIFSELLRIASAINVSLAAFNLLPIPPLDGSSLVDYFAPGYRDRFIGVSFVFFLALIFIPVGNGTLLTVIMNPLRLVITEITTLFGLIA